ncbi:MAG: TonB-dependent receptor plug domain-containing protein [Bacteroidota bacterium]
MLGITWGILLNLAPIQAQERPAALAGTIQFQGNPAIGATISLPTLARNATANGQGHFLLEDIPLGIYQLEVSYLGAKRIRDTIQIQGAETKLSYELQPVDRTLDEVTIAAQTTTAEVASRPITIQSLDAKALSNQALGAEELLKRSTGVVVRQQGGLGSQTSINLNGLTGAAVRIYYDGIPLQVYGGGIQLNNLPIDALERVDVYKGVMPVEVGTDALGGGINLIPREAKADHLRASYTLGSFNTHRITLNGKKNLSDQFALSVMAFANYSDNDYRMKDVVNLREVPMENGMVRFEEEIIDVRRFHNQHRSAFVEAEARWTQLEWADRLSFATAFTHRLDEVQHGQSLLNISIGEAQRSLNTFSQRVDYRKKLWNDRLNLRYFGTLSYTLDATQDSSLAVYNWRGEQLASITNATGSEIFSIPTLRTGQHLGTAHRWLVDAKLTDGLSLTLSDFFRFSDIRGEDPAGRPLMLGGEPLDPNTVPSRLTRNIFGAELKAQTWGSRLNAVLFYKNYQYSAESIDILQRNAARRSSVRPNSCSTRRAAPP